MALQPLEILYTGVFIAVLSGVYGWLVALIWSPFLVAGRFRGLFRALPPAGWRVNYALWMPLPAAFWGFLFGSVLSLSLDVRPETKASPIYVAGLDGIALATLVSLPLWPILFLHVLPAAASTGTRATTTPGQSSWSSLPRCGTSCSSSAPRTSSASSPDSETR